jgi:hypothetical protein
MEALLEVATLPLALANVNGGTFDIPTAFT